MLPKDVLIDTSTRKEVCTQILFKTVLVNSTNYFCCCSFEDFLKMFLTLSYHVLQLCPTFSSSIIRNVLDGFVPDEFCPDPVQDSLLQALESEVSLFYF
jgi:hypothetical protein